MASAMTHARTNTRTTAEPAASGAGDFMTSGDLLGLRGLPRDAMLQLLRRARALTSRAGRATAKAQAATPETPTLAGKLVATLFFEPSTRTRVSFEIAAKRLGAECVHAGGPGASVSKGETIAETARTIDAMGPDAIVVRAEPAGAASMVARTLDATTRGGRARIINAGDGRRAHPTQGLLDALALADALDRAACALDGVHAVIVGDIANSRVARSDIYAFTTLGARVTLVGPPALAPKAMARLAPNVRVTHDLDEALADAPDAVQALRVQFERRASIASPRAYRSAYGLTDERASRLKPGTVIMHPGPANPGLEIDLDVLTGAHANIRSMVSAQVAAGVAVRMAVLEQALGAATPTGDA